MGILQRSMGIKRPCLTGESSWMIKPGSNRGLIHIASRFGFYKFANGWKLLTNDEDCSTGGIEVITALPALLRACK